MDRIKSLVEKKIAARKDILQAETDYKTAQTELHTDEERLSLYGVARLKLKGRPQKAAPAGPFPHQRHHHREARHRR